MFGVPIGYDRIGLLFEIVLYLIMSCVWHSVGLGYLQNTKLKVSDPRLLALCHCVAIPSIWDYFWRENFVIPLSLHTTLGKD